jgi:diguanylate cyclase (GGDEF)-like protein/PAS domain S-box-containing protein
VTEERYRLAVEGANDAIWDWNILTDIANISFEWADMLGLSKQVNNYKCEWLNLIHPEDTSRILASLDAQLEDVETDFYRDEYRLKAKNGSYIWIYSRGKLLRDSNGLPIRIAGSHTDITERMNIQAKFENLAYYDDLTGLYNKIMLKFLLELEIEKSMDLRHEFALLLLGLDNFKSINDTYGHEFGDKFLIKAAEKLKEFKNEHCQAARYGGSKFAIIVKDIVKISDVSEHVMRIINRFSSEWNIDEKQILPKLSVGIAMYPSDGVDANILLRNADMAMYKAKEEGNSSYCFFEKTFYLDLLKKIDTERRLRLAIMKEELVLFYQPQLQLGTDKISGMEALVRWMDPEKGMISPAEFIPIAEDTGLIIDLGYWVIRTACKQIKNFRLRLNSDIKMSVNVSAIQLRDIGFVNKVRTIIEEEKVDAENMVLEITESVIINNFEENRKILNDLRCLGFKIALDDFGTGYSSLSYLNQIPIDEVKIDRLFVSNLFHDSHKRAVVDMIIELSHKLGLEVTAEGVEHEKELEYLRGKNCDRIQGYLLSKPFGAEDIINKCKNELSKQIVEIIC